MIAYLLKYLLVFDDTATLATGAIASRNNNKYERANEDAYEERKKLNYRKNMI